MDKKLWLKFAAGLSFLWQSVKHLFPFLLLPPHVLGHRHHSWRTAALVFAIFGLYGLSGGGSIRHLPLLSWGWLVSAAFICCVA